MEYVALVPVLVEGCFPVSVVCQAAPPHCRFCDGDFYLAKVVEHDKASETCFPVNFRVICVLAGEQALRGLLVSLVFRDANSEMSFLQPRRVRGKVVWLL